MQTMPDAIATLERMHKSLKDDLPGIQRMRLHPEAKAKMDQAKRDEIEALSWAISEMKAAKLRIYRVALSA